MIDMSIGSELGFIKTLSLAFGIIAVIFAYQTFASQNNLYAIFVVVFALLALFSQIEENKVRRYEADKLVEKARLEAEGKINAEKEKTTRNNIKLASKGISKIWDLFK